MGVDGETSMKLFLADSVCSPAYDQIAGAGESDAAQVGFCCVQRKR